VRFGLAFSLHGHRSESGDPAEDDVETATAQLAIADADGRVFAVPVSQALDIKASVGAKRNHELGSAVRVADADGRAATQLEWVPAGGKVRRPLSFCVKETLTSKLPQMQLAYTRLGTAHLAQLADAQVVHEWEVELETVGGEQWMGATSWAPAAGALAFSPAFRMRRCVTDDRACTGLQYLPSRDALLVTLSSGSFHLLRLPSCHFSPLLHDTTLSSTYTSAARACFVTSLERARQHKDRFKAEGHGAVTRREGAKVLGMVALTSGNDDMDVAWVFEYVSLTFRLTGETGAR